MATPAKLKFKVGEKVKLLSTAIDPSGYYFTGKSYEVQSVSGQNRVLRDLESGQIGGWISIALLAPESVTREDLEKDMERLSAELREVELRLRWMTETNTTEFNLDEYKAYAILTVVDGTESKIEKARAIAKFIKAN